MIVDESGREIVRTILEPWRNVLGWGDQSLGHRLEEERTEAFDALGARIAAAEAERDNWRNDFQEACRQREAAEAQIGELRRQLEKARGQQV